LPDPAGSVRGIAKVVGLSKVDDYLVDDIYAHILSLMIEGFQEESERAARLFPKSGHGEREAVGIGKLYVVSLGVHWSPG
jgi:hypothetical protein